MHFANDILPAWNEPDSESSPAEEKPTEEPFINKALELVADEIAEVPGRDPLGAITLDLWLALFKVREELSSEMLSQDENQQLIPPGLRHATVVLSVEEGRHDDDELKQQLLSEAMEIAESLDIRVGRVR